MKHLGDIAEDATIDFKWSSNDGDGASITRAVDGTVSVYKANNVVQSVAGVVDTEDFDGLTGIHHCRIDLSADAFYATGNDYQVVLSAATIDGQTVNAVLAEFSIEHRFMRGTDSANTTKTGYTLTNLSDANAAKLEDILDGTGGTGLTLDSLVINGSAGGGVVDIDNAGGPGVAINGSTLGVDIDGAAGSGVQVTGTTHGLEIAASAGPGVEIDGTTFGIDIDCSNGPGIQVDSANNAAVYFQGGGAGAGIYAVGGATNAPGIHAFGTGSGAGIYSEGGNDGHGIQSIGGALTGDGIYAAGQTAGDGMTLLGAGAGQYDLNADVHGTIDVCTTNTDMRGTDNAALASVCTEARLAELAAANLPADVDTLLTRITAAVALASVCTEGRLSELDAANIPADLDSVVTAVVGALTELTGIADAPATPTLKQAVTLLYMWLRNNTQTTSTERRILNDAGTEILDATMSDDGTTFQQGKVTAP